MAIKTLLQRKDEEGVYTLFYLSGGEAHGEPEGLYVDIVRFDSSKLGYSKRVGSYCKGANIVFSEYGEVPEYARLGGRGCT